MDVPTRFDCCSRLGFINPLAVTAYGAVSVAPAAAAPSPPPAGAPRTRVVLHFVPSYDPTLTDEDWAAPVRPHFTGEIVVGHDLLDV